MIDTSNYVEQLMKEKLTLDHQIEHMRDTKGILFNIVNEETAKEFLCHSNYYFKIKAYAKNYEKYKAGDKKGKYINLEFAYLQELSTIDMHIRNFIMRMTTDIEHYLKTKMLAHCSENPNEDGYEIVNEYLLKQPRIKEEIDQKCVNSACSDLVIKYQNAWSLWNIVEVISFGDFIYLFQLYSKKYNFETELSYYIWSIRFLRNAAAHNNCLINSLKNPYLSKPCPKNPCEKLKISGKHCSRSFTKTKTLYSFLSLHLSSATDRKISKDVLNKMMQNPVIHDFVTMIYVYNKVCSTKSSEYMMSELKQLFENRVVRNKNYFINNQVIVSCYNFIKITIDYFYKRDIMS